MSSCSRFRPWLHTSCICCQSSQAQRCHGSRGWGQCHQQKEVRRLFNRETFSLVHVNAVPSHANIIGTRIISRLKHFGIIDKEAKARLIIQGCQDAEKNRIVSNTPTVSHASIHILISFAAIKDEPVWTRDATQAFLQSKYTFSRDLYARIPLKLGSVFKGYVLKLLKPLHRYKGGWDILKRSLFKRSEAESGRYFVHAGSMFYDATCNQAKDAPHRIAANLVDDTLMTGNMHFAKAVELMHSNYNMG
jgi:hypothetical protein